jgi:hypothetical protein
MPGHIKLGLVGDLRDYAIRDMGQYARTPANQFAAKLATGAGSYDDLQNWSYLVMDDWRAGVGKTDVEAGGFLYAEAETRYPNRLTNPNALYLALQEHADNNLNYGWQPGKDLYPDTTITLSGTNRIAKKIVVAFNIIFYIYLDSSNTAQLTVSLHFNNAGLPDAQVTGSTTATITPSGEIGYHLYQVQMEAGTAIEGDQYHIVIKPTSSDSTITLPANSTNVDSAEGFSFYAGSWANYTAGSFLHAVTFPPFFTGDVGNVVYFPATGHMYTSTGNWLYKKENDSSPLEPVAFFAADITDMCVVGNELWVAIGDDDDLQIISDEDEDSAGDVPANLLLLTGGRLWRTVAGDAYYSSDGATWDGPIEVAKVGDKIRGLSFLDDFIYCATDDGLYYIGYGDLVLPVTKWGSVSPTNGVGMINHQGSLFIPLGPSLLRFDGGQMLPVGFDLGEGLPQSRVGTIVGLLSMNNWLVAAYSSIDEDTQRSTLWAYNDQGWHYLAGMPWGITLGGGLAYNVVERRLYIGGEDGTFWILPIADSANFNNIAAYPMPKMPFAWMETHWFSGGLLEVFKDVESLYITGDGFDSTHYAKLYWKDDFSTGWELLGTVTSNRAEVRWADYSTRPDTREIKIGVALYSGDDDAPVVRAIRMKYHPMVMDWFRWTFPILVSDYTELLGGDTSPYTREEQEEHLTALLKSRAPLILQDVDGVSQYEVKVTGCPVQVMDFQWLHDGPRYNAIYNIALEQIRPDGYEG